MDHRSGYDLIIIGGGATGLSAGLQAGKLGLKAAILEREMTGGWLVNADVLDDYPGFPNGISGVEMAMGLAAQVEKLGIETRLTEAVGIEKRNSGFIVDTAEGGIAARTVIVASGAAHRKLGLPNEEELEGSGISYCATCDGPFFRNQPVAVVGGGDEALRDALHLTQFAAKVVVVHGDSQLEACHWLRQRAAANPKVEIRLGSMVEAIMGDSEVNGLQLRHPVSGTASQLEVSGVFVALGGCPNTGFLTNLLSLSPSGAVPTNAALETKVGGLFAAGIAREGHTGDLPVALAEGILASLAAKRFIEGNGQFPS